MKTSSFIIFISIVLSVYISANYYIFIRGWQSLPNIIWIKRVYILIFILVFLSYIAGRFLERCCFSLFSDITIFIGSFWLGAMLYLFLFLLFYDILRVINHFIPFFPEFIKNNYQSFKFYLFGFTVTSVFIILLIGYINASNPNIKKIDIYIDKEVSGLKELNVVVVSDIHIGAIINKSRVEKLVASINQLKPDLVVFPGDIVDEVLPPVIHNKMGEPLKTIKAPLGIFAVTGNHEYIGGVTEATDYIKSLGIKIIRDSYIVIDDKFYLIGREDRDISRFTENNRKQLDEIIKGVDRTKPMILIDHQPHNLEIAEKNGIDLQISGHTHHGQLWPFNYITKSVYEVSWGFHKRGNTQYYVSSGYGTWGPPVRLGNTPEIVNLKIKFK